MTFPETAKSQEIVVGGELLKLTETIDRFEGYKNPHAMRIAVLADAVAERFNLAEHDRQTLQQASLLHDVGELVMNRSYINRDGILSREEWIDMQRHPVIGEQEAAKKGLSRAVQLIVRWHHEWWSGSGYPDGLQHEEIPLAARILRLCDTYAAMTDSRPYSVPISASEAKRYLKEWAGIEFDPRVVRVFLSIKGLKELESHADSVESN